MVVGRGSKIRLSGGIRRTGLLKFRQRGRAVECAETQDVALQAPLVAVRLRLALQDHVEYLVLEIALLAMLAAVACRV